MPLLRKKGGKLNHSKECSEIVKVFCSAFHCGISFLVFFYGLFSLINDDNDDLLEDLV